MSEKVPDPITSLYTEWTTTLDWKLTEQRIQSEQLQLLGSALRVTAEGIAILTPAVEAAGPRAEQVFAFVRQDGAKRAVVVIPRLVTRGGDFAQTTLTLPKMRGRNVFTGKVHDIAGEVAVADLLSDFPVALLLSTAAG